MSDETPPFQAFRVAIGCNECFNQMTVSEGLSYAVEASHSAMGQKPRQTAVSCNIQPKLHLFEQFELAPAIDHLAEQLGSAFGVVHR